MSANAVKMAVSRLRNGWRELLRAEVERTFVSLDDEEIKKEMIALINSKPER
jgi:hypothetical protein